MGALLVFTVLQWVIPSRRFEKDRWQYMLSNLGIVVFNNIVIGFIPLIPFQMAVLAEKNGYGLLSYVSMPGWMVIVIGLLLLDIVIYFQHRLFHQVGFLWRLHSMHHIDPMLDTTSGLRFHPVEIIISNFIKVGTILILGIAPLTVMIFEIALNFLSMFNHSNLRLHPRFERF